MISAIAIVPPVERQPPAPAWAPRLLVIECLATGASDAEVARMLGLRSVDELAPVLARHRLERSVTADGVVLVVGARVAP